MSNWVRIEDVLYNLDLIRIISMSRTGYEAFWYQIKLTFNIDHTVTLDFDDEDRRDLEFERLQHRFPGVCV